MPGQNELVSRYLEALDVIADDPSVDLLSSLINQHCQRFAFASVGPQLGDDLPLATEAVFDRIVEQKRGGYCFEQNALFFEVLNELGFDTQLILARVLHEPGSHPPLTHRITIVTIEGQRYLADVGFGATGATFAVPLDSLAGETASHRVVEHEPGELHLEHVKGEGYTSLYRFELSRYGESDCELGHFYSHRHPDAGFVNNLVASLILPSEIRSLRNLDYRVFVGDEERRVVVASSEQLRSILTDQFDLLVTKDESAALYSAVMERAGRS